MNRESFGTVRENYSLNHKRKNIRIELIDKIGRDRKKNLLFLCYAKFAR